MAITALDIERFWKKTVPKDSGCLQWVGATFVSGYGLYQAQDGKRHRAHRFAYLTSKSPIPKELEVCHQCNNKLCVNPEHLVIGTHDANLKQAATDGLIPKGEKHHKAKLTAQQVKEIRNSTFSNKQLVEKFNVSSRNIRAILNNEIWIGV